MNGGETIQINDHIFYEILAAGDEMALRLRNITDWLSGDNVDVIADRVSIQRWKAAVTDVSQKEADGKT